MEKKNQNLQLKHHTHSLPKKPTEKCPSIFFHFFKLFQHKSNYKSTYIYLTNSYGSHKAAFTHTHPPRLIASKTDTGQTSQKLIPEVTEKFYFYWLKSSSNNLTHTY